MSQVYSVRKRIGQWTVCSDENVVLRFETYDLALSTARDAGQMLATQQPSQDTAKPLSPVLSVPPSHRRCSPAPTKWVNDFGYWQILLQK
jgi:hypothetical protein